MCSSPRTRSPADWFKTSWEIFIPVAQHARAVPPSVTSRASLLRTGSSTALMASALSTGRTALTTAPLRSAATRIGMNLRQQADLRPLLEMAAQGRAADLVSGRFQTAPRRAFPEKLPQGGQHPNRRRSGMAATLLRRGRAEIDNCRDEVQKPDP